MNTRTFPIEMKTRKSTALVAHDNKKRERVEWVEFNKGILCRHQIFATGTTGRVAEGMLDIHITRLGSGPLGGDQQPGAKTSGGQIDFLIFFRNPLEPQPHDPDVPALLRIAVVWNIPIACTRSSADFMISSPLMSESYQRLVADYGSYRARSVQT